MPNFLRISSRSSLVMAEKFFPRIHTSPELGCSNPTSVRSSVLLPEPEPPRITIVSPAGTSKLIPCRISRSPYLTRRFRTDIAEGVALVLGVGFGLINLPWRRHVENCRENQIHHYHQKNRLHHRRCRRTPHLLGTEPRRKTFLAAHRRDHQSKHRGLNQPGHDVALQQRV